MGLIALGVFVRLWLILPGRPPHSPRGARGAEDSSSEAS